MTYLESEDVARARALATSLGLDGEFIHHCQSGRTTEDAQSALNIPASDILKTLILISEIDGRSVGVILLGSDRLSFKEVEHQSKLKKLRFASPDEIKVITSFAIGGVPPMAVSHCAFRFIDRKVLDRPIVVGAGGNEFCGYRVAPGQLCQKLNLQVAALAKPV
jgi:prolyl-tRNA editing enzyme YbaK/EbsC (Cys-tRNA(Pro) deacylase)